MASLQSKPFSTITAIKPCYCFTTRAQESPKWKDPILLSLRINFIVPLSKFRRSLLNHTHKTDLRNANFLPFGCWLQPNIFFKNLWVQRKSFVEDFSKVAFISSLREQVTGQRLDLGIMRKLEPRHGQL